MLIRIVFRIDPYPHQAKPSEGEVIVNVTGEEYVQVFSFIEARYRIILVEFLDFGKTK